MSDYGFVVTISLLVLKVYALAPVTWFMVFIPFGICIALELLWFCIKYVFKRIKKPKTKPYELSLIIRQNGE